MIIMAFMSINGTTRSTLFFASLWALYSYVLLWASYDNWPNIKYVLGNSSIFFLVILKYAKFEDLKKCFPFFFILIFYFFYGNPMYFTGFFHFNPVPFFKKLFALRNALSFLFMIIFFKVIIKNREEYDWLIQSLIKILLVFAILSIISFVYYPILKTFWEYKFDLLYYGKRGVDFELERSFWGTGNALTRLGNYHIPRFSGLFFHAITAGYMFGCGFAVALFRRKKSFAWVFGLASFLTFAKVSWLLVGFSTLLFYLKRKLGGKKLIPVSFVILSIILVEIYLDIIPTTAFVHLLGIVKVINNWKAHLFGYGLGMGGTWAIELKGLLPQAAKGGESGLGVMVTEIGMTGVIVYFITLSSLLNLKKLKPFSFSIILLIFTVFILQENSASPMPAFSLAWIYFESRRMDDISAPMTRDGKEAVATKSMKAARPQYA
jgi:hypothetical protein